MNLMTPSILSLLNKWIAEDKVYKFYKIKEWRTIRLIAKKRDNNECQRCKSLGNQSKADMVHHVKEVRHYPALALDVNNTESLCNACHNIEHPEKLAKHKKESKFINEERW